MRCGRSCIIEWTPIQRVPLARGRERGVMRRVAIR